MCSGNVSLVMPGGSGTHWGPTGQKPWTHVTCWEFCWGRGCAAAVSLPPLQFRTRIPSPSAPSSESRKAALSERCYFHGELPVEREKP